MQTANSMPFTVSLRYPIEQQYMHNSVNEKRNTKIKSLQLVERTLAISVYCIKGMLNLQPLIVYINKYLSCDIRMQKKAIR